MARLGDSDVAAFGRWGDGLHWEPARGAGANRAYQARISGEREPLISRPGQTETWADGLNRSYGSVSSTVTASWRGR